MAKRILMPSTWADWKPFGVGETKPHHFTEIAKTAWENRGHPLYAWRILNKGCCDGCALGTTGLHDWTMTGVHLCTTRLEPAASSNTMDAMPWERLRDDLAGLRAALQRASCATWGGCRTRWCAASGEPGFRRVTLGRGARR